MNADQASAGQGGPGASDDTRIGRSTYVVVAVVVLAVLATMLVLHQTRSTPAATPDPGPDTPTEPVADVDLEFAVWGSPAEIAAYEGIVEDYNASAAHVEVTLTSFEDPVSLLAAMDDGEIDPDVYLLRRMDLADTLESDRNVPLLDLLDARGVAFGDDYSRDSFAAFTAEDNLQCMPYGTSPMLMYYNTDLIDFEAIAERGLPVPNEERTSWSLEAFAAAAQDASKPRRGTRGVYIEPTLEGLAPFVLSGGGQLFDDPVEPTSLALEEESSVDAVRRALEVLRDPKVTLSAAQLRRRSGAEWFAEGKVAMIAGYRDLVPALREVPGLDFDVLPMPSLGSAATIGELTGLCIGSGRPASAGAAADFLVYLVSDEAVARITQLGHLHPTNVQIAFSDAFLQPGLEPESSAVFNSAARAIQLQPLLDDLELLETTVGPQVRELFTAPVLDDLETLLAEIDATSQTVLGPDEEPGEESTGDPAEESTEPSGEE